jgi:hypothetical protein
MTDETPDTYDYQHGDVGDRPADGLNFQINGRPDAQTFDWLFTTVTAKIDGVIRTVDKILTGTLSVGRAESAAEADSAIAYKGNDIDSDGDGIVDRADSAAEADTANLVKGNDIDADGDGTVDEADSAITVKNNDIDTDGDGIVDRADSAAEADTTPLVKGNDIDTDGDGIVDRADSAAEADTSGLVKGNDIDTDGDGIVDTSDETRAFESRSNFPSNADAGRVVYRPDLR